MLRTLIVPMLVIAGGCLGGCAAPRAGVREAALLSERPPADFSLAVAVMAPDAAMERRERPAALRPARYIVEADRVLRAAVGPGAEERVFPDQTRQLTAEQVESLWKLLRASPLVEGNNPARVGRAPDLEAAAGRTVYVVEWSAGGVRRTLALDADAAAGEGGEEVRGLVERLAGLAWVE